MVLAGVFYGWDLSRTVIRFNRHVRGFDELVEKIPLHRRVLTLVLPCLSRSMPICQLSIATIVV